MGKRLTEQVRRALELLPLTRIAEGIDRAYPTLQAYKYGQRVPTPAAARDLAAFLRRQSEEFGKVADELEAAAEEEES